MGVISNYMDKNTLIRFQKKFELDILTGCWLWKASKDSSGYGKFVYNGKLIGAHRLSYQYWNGSVTKGLEIDHLCRTRSCVNPAHLELITHKENIKRGDLRTNNFNSHKLICPQGHKYTNDNLVISELNNGTRKCRICHNERVKKYYRQPEIRMRILSHRKQLRSGLKSAS